MRLKDFGALVLLAAIWGSSYLFIRVAVDPLGPLVVATARASVGALCLIAYALATGRRSDVAPWSRRFAVLGFMNSAIPYGLIAFAELHLTASMAGILNATVPLFTAIVVALWDGERLPPAKIGGLVLGMVGVGILLGWNPAPVDAWLVVSVVAMLLASLAYGASNAYGKRALRGVSSLQAAIGQQSAAVAILLPFGAGTFAAGASDATPSVEVVLAILALGVLSTAFAYLIYFRLLATVGPVNTASVTFLIPIFGLLWSALFLDEAIHRSMVVGLAVILASVGLVTGMRSPFRRAPATPNAVRPAREARSAD